VMHFVLLTLPTIKNSEFKKKFKMAAAAVLKIEKSAISQQRFDRLAL